MHTGKYFQDLWVWQVAYGLSLGVYKATKNFPKDELDGLTSQLRRAAVSTALNIAEGSKRTTTRDLCHFLTMAEGSNEEVKSALLISRDLAYLTTETFDLLYKKCSITGSLIYKLRQTLNKSDGGQNG